MADDTNGQVVDSKCLKGGADSNGNFSIRKGTFGTHYSISSLPSTQSHMVDTQEVLRLFKGGAVEDEECLV